MKKFAAAAILVLTAIGMTALIYIESADSTAERAARRRGCLLCHRDTFTTTPLKCLQHWQHGTPLCPLVRASLLTAHPTLPGNDTELLSQYIAAQQLPLLAENRKEERGAALYAAKCAACHGKHGEGQPGNYPPLQGSEWLTPSPERPSLERIIQEGVQGPISVKGQAWNSTMLPPGISDEADIKALIDYLQRFN